MLNKLPPPPTFERAPSCPYPLLGLVGGIQEKPVSIDTLMTTLRCYKQ